MLMTIGQESNRVLSETLYHFVLVSIVHQSFAFMKKVCHGHGPTEKIKWNKTNTYNKDKAYKDIV